MKGLGHGGPVIVIGAGPAGIATAIQLVRCGVKPLLLERARPGGLLWNANHVENYPGFPTGISGPSLAQLFVDQASRLGVDVTYAEVTSLRHAEDGFRAETPGRTYVAPVVVVATGTRPRTLVAPAVPVGLEDRVLYEIHPLLGLEGGRIAVVGAGDAAFDYALNLARKNRVLVLNRGARLKCLPLLWERSRDTSGIAYHPLTVISRMARSESGGIDLECTVPSGTARFEVDYLVGALGRDPELSFVAPEVLEDAGGSGGQGGLLLVGDVKNGDCRQTSIAVGDGVRAAMQIRRAFVGEPT